MRLRCAGLLLLAVTSALADDLVDAVAVQVAEGWRHRVWSLYPPEKLKADEPIQTDRKSEGIEVRAAGGEAESLVLVLRSEVPLRQVKVEAASFKGPGGAVLAGQPVEVRRVAYVYVDEPSGTRIQNPMPFRTGTGLFPDPLVPGPGIARPEHNLQFWVTIDVPRGTPAGAWQSTLTMRWRHEGWMPPQAVDFQTIPLTLTVRNFDLPSPSPLRNTAFFGPSQLAPERRTPEQLATLYADFVAHRQTPEPILPSPVISRSADGALQVDSTAWEAAAAVLFDELHVSHVFIPVWQSGAERTQLQGVYFLWHYPMVTKQRWQGPFIADEQRRLTPEFKEVFGAYLRHMTDLLRRRGWLDRAYLTTMDEPYTYHASGDDRAGDTPENNYDVIRDYVTFVREVAPGLKTFCTADPTPELAGLIDHWCLRNLTHAVEARQRVAEHGEELTFCDNYRTFVDYPAVSARTLGWLAWKLGARGWLTYETMGGFATAWEGPVVVYPQFNGATVWGLGQMFYPDPVSLGVLGSVRWEMMREGAEDYEYLWLLRQQLEAKPDAPGAAAARELLASAAAEVVGGSGDPETASGEARPNVQSNSLVEGLRDRVAGLIESLR